MYFLVCSAALPSGWQAYPGMRIDFGVPLGGTGMTGDQCVALCDASSTCQAVDFNSGDGTCYSHESMSAKCNVFTAANAVYHTKKPPACGKYEIMTCIQSKGFPK